MTTAEEYRQMLRGVVADTWEPDADGRCLNCGQPCSRHADGTFCKPDVEPFEFGHRGGITR
jgi:hypothetical protein